MGNGSILRQVFNFFCEITHALRGLKFEKPKAGARTARDLCTHWLTVNLLQC